MCKNEEPVERWNMKINEQSGRILIANKHVKLCSTSLIAKECKYKQNLEFLNYQLTKTDTTQCLMTY